MVTRKRPKHVGMGDKHETRDVQGVMVSYSKAFSYEGADLEFGGSKRQNRLQIGKQLREGESGKPDKLKNKQERRQNTPGAAAKRPKSTEKHLGDA